VTTRPIRPVASLVPLLAIFIVFGFGTFARSATAQQKHAISATVTGNDQHVGFRAMIMKQAIKYNLAGSAKNDRDDIVQFTLQGDADRIDAAIAAVREGTKKSSNIEVRTAAAEVDLPAPLLSAVEHHDAAEEPGRAGLPARRCHPAGTKRLPGRHPRTRPTGLPLHRRTPAPPRDHPSARSATPLNGHGPGSTAGENRPVLPAAPAVNQ